MSRIVRVGTNGTAPGRALWLWCPACDDSHRIVFDSPTGWTWDGNETAPTIQPSIRVRSGPDGVNVCHSFVTAGVWSYLDDCTHAMAGQTTPVVELPEA